jgi:[histone H3]-lysine4 N-trimethyltransferase ATXR3
MLERHKDDPDGYDVLFVDPINKGNYSSRFSHSCDPNCGTITTISSQKYCVAMYSLKPINYGEELTFDYYSVTENEKEHKQAVCLCGSKYCKTYYLQLVTSKQQNAYLDKHLCFLKRNWLVYKCSVPLDDSDRSVLNQYSYGNAILEGCPTWLKKWAALILKFIQEEKEKYVEFTFPRKKVEMEIQYQKKPLDKETIEQIVTLCHLIKFRKNNLKLNVIP